MTREVIIDEYRFRQTRGRHHEGRQGKSRRNQERRPRLRSRIASQEQELTPSEKQKRSFETQRLNAMLLSIDD